MKLLFWNVNGARAGWDKGTLVPRMEARGAEAIRLQETKCHSGDVAHVSWPSECTDAHG
jgi:exodeoxyribonuclease III